MLHPRTALLLALFAPLGLRAAAPPPAAAPVLLGGDDRGAGPVCCLAVSADGRTVAAGRSAAAAVWVWDLPTRRRRHRIDLPAADRPACLAFSPDGKTLAAAGEARAVFLLDPATGKPRRRLATPARTYALAFSPDGKTLAVVGDEPAVRLYDVAAGREVRAIRSDNQYHRAVCFSPDGKTLAAGGDGPDLTLWDPATGEVVRDCRGGRGGVGFAAFTADGRHVVWATRQSTVRIHDPATGDEVARYDRNETVFRAFALAPAGQLLATAGDGGLRVWDLASSCLVRALPIHRGGAAAVAFSADGRTLVAGGPDGRVRGWRVASLAADRLRLFWRLLGSDAADEVRRGEEGLRQAAAVPFLRERLLGVLRASSEVPGLLAGLDADTYADRQRATEQLVGKGSVARAPLRRLLAGNPSLEVYRRAERVLACLADEADEERCALRALGVLEKLGPAHAGPVLRALAGVPGQTALARQARAALRRLEGPRPR
jgi:WD40 repeat protein